MKKLLQLGLASLITATAFLSCKGDKKTKDEPKYLHVLRIECESRPDTCGNQPGLRFSGDAFGRWIEPAGKEGHFERIPYHYTICCENIPVFTDSLKAADSLRRVWIRDKPDSMDKVISLPGNIRIRIHYEKEFLDEHDFSFMGFGDPSAGKTFYVDLGEFTKLTRDIEERFRTCCLQ